VRDELGIELKKSNEAGYIADQDWHWPMLQEFMFRHGRTVTIGGYVNANKFQPLREEMAFLEAKG
jgi:hypothetical protein